MYQKEFSIITAGQGLTEITSKVRDIVYESKKERGLCNIFIKHTSASLLIQENASSEVLEDLNNFFKILVPEDGNYIHNEEGPDDMPAHIKNALTETSLLVPINERELDMGTWQGIFIFEHRHSKFKRNINVSVFE
ncbi:MAG: hypothetical protein CL768_00250 [Chloroflexi bacterium]|nr:hypothetical protein [Chloroflexota bacterium]|tara:strand:+ start:2992 stop:3399 length:408 start_codon:yes stop_codon:yes gene_type:complete